MGVTLYAVVTRHAPLSGTSSTCSAVKRTASPSGLVSGIG
jgi:hypothetical protein